MTQSATYDEKVLLSRVASGDAEAFTELFNQHRDRVYSQAMRILQHEATAKDTVQDIFMAVWTNRHKLAEIVSFKAWLTIATRNSLLNRLRRQTSEITYIKETIYRGQASTDEVFDTVTWNEMYSLLLQAVQLLTPQQRKVFELDRFEGLKHAEIAERLGLSKETVKKHMGLAMKNIQEHFRASGRDLTLLLILLATLP